MAGRIPWILAGAAALVGGLIYQDRIGFDWGDHTPSAVVVDVRGERAEIDPATAKVLAAAIGQLAKAEARLATMDALGDPSPEELQAAKAERDRAEAEVDRIEAAIDSQAAHSDKSRLREEIRAEVREAVRNT